jgi:syntaxin 18
LRQLSHAITNLSHTEQLRREAETQIAYKKRAKRGLGALGRWAAGGAVTAKSPDEELEDAKSSAIKAHRESVIWYLQRALEECGRFQSSMMEIRITREIEKSKSVLYKARGTMPTLDDYPGSNGSHSVSTDYRGKSAQPPGESSVSVEQQLDPEQLQLFAQENQDMLKYYEDTLDQVR